MPLQKVGKMKKIELIKLLENFSDETEVCVEDHSTGSCRPIEEVVGAVGTQNRFLVRLSICGGN